MTQQKGCTMAQKATPQEEIDQLSDQISTLKRDIADISQTLADLGQSSRDSAAAQAREKAAEMREKGRAQMDHAQDMAEDFGRQAGDVVRNQPMSTMGIAVGLGFLLGFMTGRK